MLHALESMVNAPGTRASSLLLLRLLYKAAGAPAGLFVSLSLPLPVCTSSPLLSHQPNPLCLSSSIVDAAEEAPPLTDGHGDASAGELPP